jgi:hypothetical protein
MFKRSLDIQRHVIPELLLIEKHPPELLHRVDRYRIHYHQVEQKF